MSLKLKVETVDAALFMYPDFVAKATTPESQSKGIVEFFPRSGPPGSPVERLAFKTSQALLVVEAIQAAFKTLGDFERRLVGVKYGWHYEDGKLKTTPPVSSEDACRILCKEHWSRDKFYDSLRKIRATFGAYLESLGESVYGAFREVDPGKPKRIDEKQFQKVKEFLEKQGVNFPSGN